MIKTKEREREMREEGRRHFRVSMRRKGREGAEGVGGCQKG